MRSTNGRAIRTGGRSGRGSPRAYSMMVMEICADASPNSAVPTKAVARPLPTVAPAGIVVRNVAIPDPSLVSSPVMTGTPGIESVKLTVSPARRPPSGLLSRALSSMARGRRAALIR